MVKKLGIIGAGHLAEALIEGWIKAGPEMEIVVSDIDPHRLRLMKDRFGLAHTADNQELAEGCDAVLLAVLPQSAEEVCREIRFRHGQTLISVAAGCRLSLLEPLCAPARVVRALPLTSASIRLSPTQLYPEHPVGRELFGLLGTVHVLENEDSFTPATVIAAFYGWVYALAGKTIGWVQEAGVSEGVARPLVLETMRAVAEMGLQHPETALSAMLEKLATRGGITRQGLAVLDAQGGLKAWEAALEAVHERLKGA